MILLDTNILVHAIDKNSPLFTKAKDIRDKAVNGELEACISLQNLAEFYSVVTNSKEVNNPLTSKEAADEVSKYLECPSLKKLEVKPSTMALAVQLGQRYNIIKQSFYDTQLVATMVENGVTKILTRNTDDFLIFKEIETENPLEITA